MNDKDHFIEKIDSQDTLHGVEMVDADFPNFKITRVEKAISSSEESPGIYAKTLPIGHFREVFVLRPALVFEELLEHLQAEEVVVIAEKSIE